MEERQLFSVGHSNQSIEDFFQLLESQKIDCVLDVRSLPYSKYTPHFNEGPLKTWLNQHGVLYVPFGKHFGARRSDCLKETEFAKKGIIELKPQVNFELGVTTNDFLSGVERLKKTLEQNRRVSLMCSEANPLDCHRFSFISRFFYDLGWDVKHIMRDDNNEIIARSHLDLENEMILDYVKRNKLKAIGNQMDNYLLFDFEDGYNEEQQRIDAYRLKNHEIGWVPEYDDNENYEDYL
ncbi:MAG: DUF488 domain-containing protein [Bacteroidaceae bacterium]|nr:DUF488 domain-containing protein [Bacteroidaceae bacterium]